MVVTGVLGLPALAIAAQALVHEDSAQQRLWPQTMPHQKMLEVHNSHRFCHVQIRQAEPKPEVLSARELARQPTKPQVPAPKVKPLNPAELFEKLPLLAAGGSSETLQLDMSDGSHTFTVRTRKRERSDIVLQLESKTSPAQLTLRQSKPLLGCYEHPVRSCRMSEGELTVTLAHDANSTEVLSETTLPRTEPVRIQDLCGSVRKETMFRAPINLEGLAEWRTEPSN